ncbi:MAG: low molecular weight phosphotyrosine protein phosphatase [Azoarcus sp.]|jgi:protein-tyrosine phosphatase|nr:low molecular weight phosphotyrosine protein phosphatase [Azoarcus sp.]
MVKKEKTRILFVCSGNICRSPAAEGIALHHFELYGLEGKVEVDSAGLQGRHHARQAPDPRMLRAAAVRGYDLGKLRARGLEMADYGRFDLILGMDEGHIEAMKKACPAPFRSRLKLLLDFAPETGAREVPDPYYGTQQAFEAALDLIEQGVIGLVRELTERA